MLADVYDQMYEKVDSCELPDAIFQAEIKEALLWEMVKAQRASKRAGTHCTKTRGEVSGGGAKPFKQKGTGRARQGSIRAPNHVGGGTVFGPKPRDYSYRLPRSARRSALRSALSLRVKSGDLLILREFNLDAPRTKDVLAFLGRIGEHPKTLFVDVGNRNLQLSARNLQRSKVLEAEAINVYDILNHQKLVITRQALEAIIAKVQTDKEEVAS